MLPRLYTFCSKVTIAIAVLLLCFLVYREVLSPLMSENAENWAQNEFIAEEEDIEDENFNDYAAFIYQLEGERREGRRVETTKRQPSQPIVANAYFEQRIAQLKNGSISRARPPMCLQRRFDAEGAPSASVIIAYHNESHSLLLRTLHSTLHTCSSRLLKEIILVDDASANVEPVSILDYYVKTRRLENRVQIQRLTTRSGLVRARLAGARLATANVLIFLNAHSEPKVGWCEWLLQCINDSNTTVAMPVIDSSNAKHFERNSHEIRLGGFLWNGNLSWFVRSQQQGRMRQLLECIWPLQICPMHSPVITDGVFAIDRHYFWQIGSYDEQMTDVAAANVELSFRVWQCGGAVKVVPCSRVEHMHRQADSHDFTAHTQSFYMNMARTALLWMANYSQLYFLYQPALRGSSEIGSLTERMMLRDRLHCKSFEWYLQTVYPEKFLPMNVIEFGRIKAVGSNLCLHMGKHNEDALALTKCGEIMLQSEFFSYDKRLLLRNDFSCITVHEEASLGVMLVPGWKNDELCARWFYVNQTLEYNDLGLCLDRRPLNGTHKLLLFPCVEHLKTQRWIIEHEDVKWL